MGRGARWIAMTALTSLVACGFYAASDPGAPANAEDGGVDASEAASAIDASDSGGGDVVVSPDDAGADGDAGGLVVLAADDFEDGTCSAWASNSLALTASTVAHAGGHACRLCWVSGAPGYAQRSAGAAGPGLYRFEAWLRAETPDASLVGTQLYLVYDGGQDVQFDPETLDAGWTHVESSKRSTYSIGETGQWIYIDPHAGSCVLLDDVRITFEP